MRPPVAGALLLGCLATAWPALRPGDPALAAQTWEALQADKGDAYADPLYVDVAAYQRDVAPWQEGYALCRERMEVIARGRREALSGR
ncbi:MAG: hypothetical protein H6732_00795 [Alphaproteobacteria bacterium]|nr:hypothetical protein [Alphaproteobacteria bacterium]